MDSKANGSDPVPSQLDADDQVRQPDEAGPGAVEAESGQCRGDPDRLSAERVIASAIRSTGVAPVSLPVRPELRRLRSAANFWVLLFPLAALAVSILMELLPVMSLSRNLIGRL